jgi:sugar phosphate isomerase/epimerase
MKAGYTVWTWIIRLFEETHEWEHKSARPKMDFEEAVRSVANLGYKSMECFNQIVDIYEGADEEFTALINKYGLTFDCIYIYVTEDFKKDLEIAEKCFKFSQRHGVRFANLQASPRPEGRAPTAEELAGEFAKIREIGQLGQKYGVTVCLHPHLGTMVEGRSEIDALAEQVPAQDVAFCFDTAHILTAGMDPVEAFAAYAPRLKYVHLKDATAKFLPGQTHFDRFRSLGDGIIDFPGVLEVLRDARYEGIICVELDRPPICNYDAAQTSMRYLNAHRALWQ